MKNRTEEAAITRARTPIDTRRLRERLTDLGVDALSFEDANARLDAAGLGDGLPLVPPTSARIKTMLASCAAGPGHALDMIVPAHVAPTLWDVAA